MGKSKWYAWKRLAVLLNLTWVDLAFSCTKSYPGLVKRQSLGTASCGSCPEILGGTTYFCPRLYSKVQAQ